MESLENLSTSQQVRTALHRDVTAVCKEIGDLLELEITRRATVIIAELVYNKIPLYAMDLEAFAQHAKRTMINQEDVKLLTRRNSSLKEYVSSLCNTTPSASKERRRKTTIPVTKEKIEESVRDEYENQAKKPKLTINEAFNVPGSSKQPEAKPVFIVID